MKVKEEIAFRRTKLLLNLGFYVGTDQRIPDKKFIDKLLSRAAVVETFLSRENLEAKFLNWSKENLEEEQNG